MKLGMFSWYGYRQPLKLRLEKLQQTGFDSTMLWWGDETDGTIPVDPAIIDHIHAIGLQIENIHMPFGDVNNLWSDHSEVREQFRQRVIGYIQQCRQFGIPMLVMHISGGAEVKEASRSGLEIMMEVADAAHNNGVSVAVENTEGVNLIESILDYVTAKAIGLCYDTSHGKLYEREQDYLLKKYADRLKCLHISDNDGVDDRHWNVGRGIIDWQHFVENFPFTTYKGNLSLEVYPKDPNENEEEHLKDAYRELLALSKRIVDGNQLTNR